MQASSGKAKKLYTRKFRNENMYDTKIEGKPRKRSAKTGTATFKESLG